MTPFEYPFSVRLERVVLSVLVAGIFVISGARSVQADSHEDHTAHEQHMLTDEQFAELRSKISLYKEYKVEINSGQHSRRIERFSSVSPARVNDQGKRAPCATERNRRACSRQFR